MKNLLVDYLVISFKLQDDSDRFLQWLFSYIHLSNDDCEAIKSYYGLSSCLYYRGIKIHYDNELVVLDCSGKGCRTLESLNPAMDWYKFLYVWHEGITKPKKDAQGKGRFSVHISRLDVACDALEEPNVSIPRLQGFVKKSKFLCKSNYYSCIDGNHEQAIYFGSPKSDRRLRIYDKAMEQGLSGGDWVRFEFQLRNDNATSFFLNLVACGGDFAKCYFGMLRDYLRFITKPNNGINQSRKVVCKWWLDFLQGVEAISQLYLPGEEYDIGSLSRFLRIECASSIKTFLRVNDGDVTELMQMVQTAKLNRRQRELLDSMGLDDNYAGG